LKVVSAASVTTKAFDKALANLPVNWQGRIVAKIKEVAANPLCSKQQPEEIAELRRIRTQDWELARHLRVARRFPHDAGFGSGTARRSVPMRVEKITRGGKEFAILPMDGLKKLMEASAMLRRRGLIAAKMS